VLGWIQAPLGKSRGKSHENPPNHPKVPWEKLLEVISRWFLGWFWWIFMGFRVSTRKNDWRLGKTSDFWIFLMGFWMSFTQFHYQTDIDEDFEVTLTSGISCRGKYARTWLRCASTCTSTTWGAFSRRTGRLPGRVFSWRPGTGAFPGADIKLDDLGLDFLWWCLMHVVHVLFDMHSFVVWN
jgi:hypothetical protein